MLVCFSVHAARCVMRMISDSLGGVGSGSLGGVAVNSLGGAGVEVTVWSLAGVSFIRFARAIEVQACWSVAIALEAWLVVFWLIGTVCVEMWFNSLSAFYAAEHNVQTAIYKRFLENFCCEMS